MKVSSLLLTFSCIIMQGSIAMAQVAYAPVAASQQVVPQMAASDNYKYMYPGVPAQAVSQPAYAAPRPVAPAQAYYPAEDDKKIDIMQLNSF